jgi:hypothetical protein
MLPVNADSKMPFTSVRDLGRLVEVIVGDLAKFRTKTVSVVSQKVTPLEMLKSWNPGMSSQEPLQQSVLLLTPRILASCWTSSNIQIIEHRRVRTSTQDSSPLPRICPSIEMIQKRG